MLRFFSSIEQSKMDGPELDLSEIVISQENRFKDFIARVEGDQKRELQPVPSSHELALIQQDMKKLTDLSYEKLAVIKKNQKTLTQWIQKHDPEGTVSMDTERKLKIKLTEKEYI
jgi:hypothetical protein